MSVGYKAVTWSGHKRVYDLVVVGAAVMSIGLVFAIGKATWGAGNSDVQLGIRALGTTAILLLHVILAIGPLARLDRRFLPILFNRRHLGVTMFLIALAHAGLATLFYHAGGVVNPLVSVLTGGPGRGGIPFEAFGAAGLLILFLMAATSHDFWLRNLGAGPWKALHMLVYVAYALLVLHVVLGAMRSEASVLYPVLLGVGAAGLTLLHLAAGRREIAIDARAGKATRPMGRDEPPTALGDSDRGIAGHAGGGRAWVDVCSVDEIPEGRGRPCPVRHEDGRVERVAVFKYVKDGSLVVSATTNVCAHQGGPLGEGKVVDGCATCPWHGWTYRPHDGCAPPPFTERIPTYSVRIVGQRVQVEPRALPAGTRVEPARVPETGLPVGAIGRGPRAGGGPGSPEGEP